MALPGLLLLHGVGDDGTCWGPFVEGLRSEPDFRDLEVVTPDAPLHGGRRHEPGHTLEIEDQVAEAIGHAEALARQTSDRIVVGGHSMGAAVALAVAAARPDLTAALWLEDPPLFGSMAADDTARETGEAERPVPLDELVAWFTSLKAQPLEDVVRMARAEHPGWDPDEYEPWARAKQSVDVDGLIDPVRWIGIGWAERARAVRCPVVVAVGDPSLGGATHPAAASDLIALEWAVHRLPVGHDVRRDAPRETTTLLADLIRTVATDQPSADTT